MRRGGDSSELPYVTLDRPSSGKRHDSLDLDFLFTIIVLYLLSRSPTIPLHKHNVRPSRSTSIHWQSRRRLAQERPLRVLAEPGRQPGIQGRKLEVVILFSQAVWHVCLLPLRRAVFFSVLPRSPSVSLLSGTSAVSSFRDSKRLLSPRRRYQDPQTDIP